jgi:hypothetical protein
MPDIHAAAAGELDHAWFAAGAPDHADELDHAGALPDQAQVLADHADGLLALHAFGNALHPFGDTLHAFGAAGFAVEGAPNIHGAAAAIAACA